MTKSIATKLIHGGEHNLPYGAVAAPIILTKTYAQPEFGVEGPWQYSRGKNPTRTILEEKLAAIEGAKYATVFGSGLAAEAMFFLTLNPGDRVLFCDEVYGGTYRLMNKVLEKFRIFADYADFSRIENIKAAITPQTKYLFIETPTNPSLKVIDLQLVQKISKKTGIPYIADLTFSPPCATLGLNYGAQAVIHSLSKYIAGHNDVLAGAVITNDAVLDENLRFMQKAVGAILAPEECYRVIQGMKTLDLRWKKASENAQHVAEYLQSHKKVKRVLYPGLTTHTNHNIAKKQMKNGFGAVLSFETTCEHFPTLKSFVNKIRERGNIIYAESLASPETILAYPPLMSHRGMPREERLKLGITDSFFRLSLGLEDAQDIIHDLEQGLKIL